MRRYLTNHNVRIAAEMGWGRLTNGDLLDAAEREGFQVMVTATKASSTNKILKAASSLLSC